MPSLYFPGNETTPVTPEDRETLRRLNPLLKAGIAGLREADWRPGMSEEALVAPILLAVLVHMGERLPLEQMKAEAAPRCPSCDHLMDAHQPDGCSRTVTTGKPDRDPTCPCTVPRR